MTRDEDDNFIGGRDRGEFYDARVHRFNIV